MLPFAGHQRKKSLWGQWADYTPPTTGTHGQSIPTYTYTNHISHDGVIHHSSPTLSRPPSSPSPQVNRPSLLLLFTLAVKVAEKWLTSEGITQHRFLECIKATRIIHSRWLQILAGAQRKGVCVRDRERERERERGRERESKREQRSINCMLDLKLTQEMST